MIAIHAKKHDNFSVEFKFGFGCCEDGIRDDFSVNAWIFVPNSLDINPENYGKKQFYRDIKSNFRLITPVYLLREIAQDTSQPLTILRRALDNVVNNHNQAQIDAYEYHLKMFAAIFKSALRDQAAHIRAARSLDSTGYLVEDYVKSSSEILRKFRALYQIIDVPTVSDRTRSYFRLCDEFMSHVVELRTTKIVQDIDSAMNSGLYDDVRQKFMNLIMDERRYKIANDFGVFTEKPEHDRQLVYHHGMLKKFIESELYIRLDKKKDGVAVQQIYYSIAAGVAMIFATAIGWYSQMKYGNITWPLFVVLVVSYMLKDRIKDLLRYYFAHRLGDKYFDKKASIVIGKQKVGQMKEGFDFISMSKSPKQVIDMRNAVSSVEDESRIFDEKILLYRKNLAIDDIVLKSVDEYPIRGVNEIMRLHLTRFTQKMDNPQVPVDVVDENGGMHMIDVEKIYYVNIVFQLQHDGAVEYHHFRITMTRNGVKDVQKI